MTLYAPLDATKQQIRLMSIKSIDNAGNISVQLHTAILNEELPFCALSYVWGDASITETVFVNDLPFQATKNLVEALKALFKMGLARWNLWVDALCINQSDTAEKSTQVALMSQIYRSAMTVIAWLGPEADNSSTVMDLFGRLAEDPNLDPDRPDSDVFGFDFLAADEYRDILDKFQCRDVVGSITALLADRPYWSRIWTFQELILAKDCLLLCGDHAMNLDQYDQVRAWLDDEGELQLPTIPPHPALASLVDTVARGSQDEMWLAPKVAGFFTGILLERDGFDIGGNQNIPLAALEMALGRRATNPKDYLYGVVNVAYRALVVDYSLSTAGVYENFAATQVNSLEDLSLLLQHSGVGRSGQDCGIPSWVPDWDWLSKFGRECWQTVSRYGLYNANGGLTAPDGSLLRSTVQHGKLSAVGVMRDEITEACASAKEWDTTPPEERLARALEFVLETDLTMITPELLPETRLKQSLLSAFRLLCQDRDFLSYKPTRWDPNISLSTAALLLLVEYLAASKAGIPDSRGDNTPEEHPEFSDKDRSSEVYR
ncbi:hypothetical protein OQA88_4371 [Cercophora sp. LCS_1]